MAKPEAEEVIAHVTELERDTGMQRLREDVRRRREQHAMTDMPTIPEHIAQGTTHIMPSAEPAYLGQVINADMSSYITTTTVIPGDREHQAKADKVERAYALKRAELFPNRIRSRMRWSQLIEGAGFYKLVCGDPSTPNPWSVTKPDFQSCFFPFFHGLRPPVLGRKYEELVSTIENGKAYRDVREKRKPKRKDGKWVWDSLSVDVAVEDSQYTGGQYFDKCMVYELDNGKETICVATNDGGMEGEVVWRRDNLTDGTAYVLVPGHITDAREPREAFLPALWASMNVAKQISFYETVLATTELNPQAIALIERDPEILKALELQGTIRPQEGRTLIEGDGFVEINGTPYFVPKVDRANIILILDHLEARLAKFASTQLSLTSGEVLKDATVRGLQLALGARQRQQGPMLTYEDEAEAEILRMWRHSITCEGGYGADTWSMHAKTTETYSKGEMKRGDSATVSKADLEFDHEIDVTTASQTREEKSLSVDFWTLKKTAGLSTWVEGIPAAGYADESAQQIALTEEEGYIMASQLLPANFVQLILETSMREGAGIEIAGIMGLPSATGTGAMEALQPPAAEQAASMPFQPPAIESVTGGAMSPEAGGQGMS